jgi:glycosyltransferase involved in cell wall biosynthesis
MSELDAKTVRVLLLHNFLSPYRVPLFEALARRFDLDVWILGDIRAVRDWPADAPGAQFRLRALPHVAIPLGSRYNVILLNYSLPRELARLKPDVIICCGWDTPASFYASFYAKWTNTPFILWSGSTAAEATLLRRATNPLVQGLVKRASAWLAYGSRAKEYLVSLGAVAEETYLAYNTVDLPAFAAASAGADKKSLRDRLGIATKYVALYCGNLLDLKGVGDLIEAFGTVCGQARTDTDGHEREKDERAADRRAADITLVLVGSGKHEARYRARARALGIIERVVFAGFVARSEMPSFYAIGDILVVPSRSEVWGLVINEALACGVPAIATDACGAAPDLIHEGENGSIVPARNIEALAGAITAFFEHPERHEAMRAAARASIAPFTIERAADAFVDAVRCALGRRR